MAETPAVDNRMLTWLLDPADPDVHYLVYRDLLNLDDNDPRVVAARQHAYQKGPIGRLLDQMEEPGYWVEPGSGYNPKYFSTVWSVILLAQLGGSVHDDTRIQRACDYLLNHTFTDMGAISTTSTPSGTADCLQGNMCWALTRLGCDDPRIDRAFEWMARTVTGEGMGVPGQKVTLYRYYAGKCGPLFACGANDRQPCAWGAVKVMQAFSVLPPERWTMVIQRAADQGVEFLLSTDPYHAEYPHPYSQKPSGNWWKFGFPVFYVTDLLQLAEALAGLGYGRDPRLTRTIQLIHEKRDQAGRWAMEYDYTGKTILDFGEKKRPNKWVTLRALKVLNRLNK